MNLGETVLVKPITNRREDDCTYPQNRAHLVTSNEEMPLVQEKLGTMELLRYRKLFESRMHDSPLIYLNLSPAGRSGISCHLAK